MGALAVAVAKFTGKWDVPTMPTAELLARLGDAERGFDLVRGERASEGRPIVLVDVRSCDEQRVSMLPHAVTQQDFERKRDQLRGCVVVAYCTVGCRSGQYAVELCAEGFDARNSEGILRWAEQGGRVYADGQPVQQLHCYAAPWAKLAPPGYTVCVFAGPQGLQRFVDDGWRLLGKQHSAKARACGPWVAVLLLFYFGLTPMCGAMFRCGCRFAASKWGQFEPCNVRVDGGLECPWCSCRGAACLLVGYDSRALVGVPLLDLLPDGTLLAVGTVLVLKAAWRSSGVGLGGQLLLAVGWFLAYTLCVGWAFAHAHNYPYFFGERG